MAALDSMTIYPPALIHNSIRKSNRNAKVSHLFGVGLARRLTAALKVAAPVRGQLLSQDGKWKEAGLVCLVFFFELQEYC